MTTTYIVISLLTAGLIFISYKFIRLYLVVKREKIVDKKRDDLRDFLIQFQNELYSPEHVISMENLKQMDHKLTERIKNHTKNMKPETMTLRDEAYAKARSKIVFDPLGILNFAAQKDIDFDLALRNGTIEMEFLFLRATIRSTHLEIFLGGLTPEAKKRLDLIQKCQAYLKEEILFKKYLELRKENALILKLNERVRFFLNMMQVPQLVDYHTMQSKN